MAELEARTRAAIVATQPPPVPDAAFLQDAGLDTSSDTMAETNPAQENHVVCEGRFELIPTGNQRPTVAIPVAGLDRDGASYTIGRDENCNLFIDAKELSRIQCALFSNDNESLLLIDKSRYGTNFVNDKKCFHVGTLKVGDRLRMGSKGVDISYTLSKQPTPDLLETKMATEQEMTVSFHLGALQRKAGAWCWENSPAAFSWVCSWAFSHVLAFGFLALMFRGDVLGSLQEALAPKLKGSPHGAEFGVKTNLSSTNVSSQIPDCHKEHEDLKDWLKAFNESVITAIKEK
eukprot:124175-Rhodomonas_salina.2